MQSADDGEEEVPVLQTAFPPRLSDRNARMWGLLWHKDYKLRYASDSYSLSIGDDSPKLHPTLLPHVSRMPIPESAIFCNGRVHSYLFTAQEEGSAGEVRRKARSLTPEEVGSRREARVDGGDACDRAAARVCNGVLDGILGIDTAALL